LKKVEKHWSSDRHCSLSLAILSSQSKEYGKPVYNDHPRELEYVAVVQGQLDDMKIKIGIPKWWPAIGRWSLLRGGR